MYLNNRPIISVPSVQFDDIINNYKDVGDDNDIGLSNINNDYIRFNSSVDKKWFVEIHLLIYQYQINNL